MTPHEKQLAIDRCDRELLEIDQRPDIETAKAYLSAMGRFDWEHEKRIIESELP